MTRESVTCLVTLLCACSSQGRDAHDPALQRATAGEDIVADTFDVTYSVNGDDLTLGLRTDLPDRTALMVSVDRTYRTHEDSVTYVVEYFSAATNVGEWRAPHTIPLDKHVISRELDERRRILSQGGATFTVKSFSPAIRINVGILAAEDPHDSRSKDHLRGRAVTTDGQGRRTIERELVLNRPLDAGDLEQTRWVDPSALRRGKTYRLARETPLVPEPEPKDVWAAIAGIRHLESGTTVRVTRVIDNNGHWYRVRILSGSASGAEGWINSTALIAQDIVELPSR